MEQKNINVAAKNEERAVGNQSINYQDIYRLYQQGCIDADGLFFAEKNLLPSLQWLRWIMRLCMGLGTALVVLGVVFFFAYNWRDMPVWSKLALIESVMTVLFVVAVIVGVRRLVGQCLLLAATVFIGVFFAVFGQIYQTGADAWQLFALWAVLMLGFVLVSHFPVQWLLQWSITGAALVLFLTQYTRLHEGMAILAFVSAYIICIWGLQVLLAKRYQWLECWWLRYTNAFIAYCSLICLFTIDICDDEIGLWVAAFVFVIASALWHKHRHKDLLVQVFSVTTLAIMLWIAALRLFIESSDFIATVFVMLIVTIGLSVGVYQIVMMLKSNFEDNNPNNEGINHEGTRHVK